MVSDELRLENDLANANSLGIVAAISVVIQAYETSRKKKFSLGILACLPAIFLLAARNPNFTRHTKKFIRR